MTEPTPFDRALLPILSGAFAAWAAVVAWGVREVTTQIAELHNEARTHEQRQERFQEAIEHRLTLVEERQLGVLQKNREQDDHMKAIDERFDRMERPWRR